MQVRNLSTFLSLWIMLTASLARAQNADDIKLMIPSGHNQYIKSLALAGDERLLASMSDEGFKIWDVASGTELVTAPNSMANGNMPFRIGNTPHIGMISNGAVRIMDGRTLRTRQLVDFTRTFQACAVVTDRQGKFGYIGGHHYSGSRAVLIQVNLATGTQKNLIEEPQYKTGLTNLSALYPWSFQRISVSPDGARLIAATSHNVADKIGYNVVIINTTTGQIERKIDAPDNQVFIFLDNQHLAHFGPYFMKQGQTGDKSESIARLVSYPGMQVLKTINTPVASGYSDGNYGNVHINAQALSYHYVNYGEQEQFRRIVSVDFKKGTAQTRNISVPLNEGKALLSPQLFADLTRIAVTYPVFKIATANTATKETQIFGAGRAMDMHHLHANPKRRMIATSTAGSSKTGTVQVIDMKPDGIRVYNYENSAWSGAVWSPDGTKAVFYNSIKGEYGLIDANALQNQPRIFPTAGQANGIYLTWAPDSKTFAHHGSNGIKFIDATTFRLIRRVDGDVRFVNMGARHPGAFSSDGNLFFAYILRPTPTDQNKSEKWILCYQVKTGVKMWEKKVEDNFQGAWFEPGDKRISGLQKNTLYILDAATGNTISTQAVPVPADATFSGQRAEDGTMVFHASNTLYFFDRMQKRMVHQINAPNATGSLPLFLSEPDFVCFKDKVNGLRLVDLQRKAEVGNLVTFMDSEDYGVINNRNYFEGSPGALGMMYFVRGSAIVPLQSLFEQLYTPRLLNRIFERSEPGPPVINVNTLKAPPVVRIQYKTGHRNLVVADDEAPSANELSTPNVTITLTASAPDDQIAEMRLFHNGKLVSPNTRNLVVANDDKEENVAYEIVLQPGANAFSAIAINSQRTESLPARLNLTYKPPQTAPPAVKTPATTMYLVVIGINQYKNTRYNLNYALADARGFEGKIRNNCGRIINECKTYNLLDANATKERIVSVMKEIATKAQPQDMLVFYYAGHGVMSETKPDFFLAPHDITQLYGNDAGLISRGISSTELQDLSVSIKAQKQLFILDACQSAGALQNIAVRGAAEEKAIAQLARSTGTHWLTASGSDQFASEFDKLGHGAFTFALLQGLSGEAALQNGSITVNSLKAYIETKVPEITEAYKGTAQYPASYGYGQDFPIGIK